MPFLRVIRDKRGYETTYLMHWCREGARQHSRILYVFRTPGGVRVGREALEPEMLKQIEASHPEIDFDWTAVFSNQQMVDTSLDRRPRKRPSSETPPPAPPQPVPQSQVPAKIEGATPDEQMAFLTRWYGVIRERIPQRISDPERQQALLAVAERLNCAAWTDVDEITAGLQAAAEALERLSHVFAKRRRRKKRGSAGDAARPEAGTAATETSTPESLESSDGQGNEPSEDDENGDRSDSVSDH